MNNLYGKSGVVLVSSGRTPLGLLITLQLTTSIYPISSAGGTLSLSLYNLQVTGTKPAGTFGGATTFTKNFWIPLWTNAAGQFQYCN